MDIGYVTLGDITKFLAHKYIPDREIKGDDGILIQIKHQELDEHSTGSPSAANTGPISQHPFTIKKSATTIRKNQRSAVSLNQLLIENHQDQSLEFSDHLEMQDLQAATANTHAYNPPPQSTNVNTRKYSRYPTIEEESPMS